MQGIDLMVFDFDGTLVRSGKDLAASVNHTLKKLGLSVLPEDHIIGYIGDGVNKLIARSLGDAFPGKFDEALSIFMDYYEEHLLDTTDLYPGVIEVLEHFKSKKKVIITNKLYTFTLKMTDELNITGFFDEIIGMDSREFNKPDARLILPIIKKSRTEVRRTVVIGDGDNDVLLAKNAGTISCALLNGLGSREKLLALQPDYQCEDIRILTEVFF